MNHTPKRIGCFILAFAMILFLSNGAAASPSDFSVENGVLTAYKGSDTVVVIPGDLGITKIDREVFCNCKSLTEVTIPSGVESIGIGAFYNCDSLTTVTIPGSVKSIGNGAFDGCISLRAVTIPGSVKSIDSYAFYGCWSLTEVTMQRGITSIGNNAFAGCSNLTSVTIPGSVRSIDDKAFSNCRGLTALTISDGVKSISEYAFAGCPNLTSVTIPGSVTSIGDLAFSGCSNLSEVIIPDSVTSIGFGAFAATKISEPILINRGKTLCYVPAGYTDYTIPNTVTAIGDGAFGGCTDLTLVTIPNSVTSIGMYAFGTCRNLARVIIPDSVTSISARAFEGTNIPDPILINNGKTLCYVPASYTSYTVPDTVTTINSGAFGGCSNLTKVIIPGSVTSIGLGELKGLNNSLTIYGEENSFAQQYAAQQEIPFSAIERQLVLKIGNPYMTVNGDNVEIDPGKGTSPVIIQGRTFVPIRAVIEAIGGNVAWDGTAQKLTLNCNSKIIELWIGRNTALVNAVKTEMDVSPQVLNGRTMAPLRFVTENLGCEVLWDKNAQSITIKY